jgi:thioredoxin 1
MRGDRLFIDPRRNDMSDKNGQLPTLTAESFRTAVLESERPALVDFSAEWCAPCKVIAPVIAALADEYGDRLTVAKVDVDESPELAMQYGVRSVPTVMVLKGGRVERTLVGARPAQEYRAGIEAVLH